MWLSIILVYLVSGILTHHGMQHALKAEGITEEKSPNFVAFSKLLTFIPIANTVLAFVYVFVVGEFWFHRLMLSFQWPRKRRQLKKKGLLP